MKHKYKIFSDHLIGCFYGHMTQLHWTLIGGDAALSLVHSKVLPASLGYLMIGQYCSWELNPFCKSLSYWMLKMSLPKVELIFKGISKFSTQLSSSTGQGWSLLLSRFLCHFCDNQSDSSLIRKS